MTAMTQEALERLPNLQAYPCPTHGENYIYADPNHPYWQGNPKDTMEYLAKLRYEKVDISDVPFWRRVKDPSEYASPYFHITAFKWRNEFKNLKSGRKHILGFDPMLIKEKGEQQTDRRHTFREGNQALRRLYMTGHEDESIHCPIYPSINIDTQVIDGMLIHNLIDAHHIVCWQGESIQKGDQDPGKLNTSVDLFLPNAASRAVVEDLMRTILVSRTGHQRIHYWRNSDVHWYKASGHKLPWALRNKTNYGKWVRKLRQIGYHSFPSYAEWMETLTLEYHGH